MSIVNQLKNSEDKIPLEDSLHFKFLIAKKHFLTIDRVIDKFHPFYTLHDHNHSEVVLNNCSALKLSKVMTEDPLNKYELFLLCAAAYLHDVGMIVIKDEDQKESREKGIQVSELIRNQHHERSFDHILSFKDRLYLDDFEAYNLALVAKGHRNVNLYDNPEYQPITCPDNANERIRIDLLAAIIRIADGLDISFKRADKKIKEILEKYQSFDFITQLHWFKHYYTIGPRVRLAPEQDGVRRSKKLFIDIEFRFPNRDYENSFIIPFVVNPIKKELDYLGPIFRKNGFSLDLGEIKPRVVKALPKIPDDLYGSISKLFLKKENIKILIVDDEEIVRENYKQIVNQMGYQVDTVKNSVEAIEFVGKNPYHLVLLDLKIPDFKNRLREDAGLDLLREIKRMNPDHHVVIITALTKVKLVRDCFKNGAYDFIEKSASSEDIKKKIETAIKMNFNNIK